MNTIRNEFPWGAIEWLASGEIGNAGELSVARMTIAPGAAIDAHVHANAEESIYVVRGIVECRVDGGITRLAAGECTIVPRGAVHRIVCVDTGPAELLLGYSSPRRTFELA